MGFIERELQRVSAEIFDKPEGSENYDKLYAAQQALAWASDPSSFNSPYGAIMGIQEGSEGCSAHPRQPSS